MNETKAPTAVICLSHHSGGMELDSIKMAKNISPYSKVVLIAKKDTFIAKAIASKSTDFSLETVSFKSTLSLSIIFNVRAIVKKYGIKNVIFFGASELKSLYFSFLGLDINLIVRHGTTKSTPKKDWFHRLIYSDVNYHVAICEHLANNVKKIIPFGAKTKLEIIYSSLSLQPSQTIDFEAKPHTPIQLLHIGRIAPGKGQKAAIEACEILAQHGIDFELTLVGGIVESYKNELLSFIDNLSYKDKIKLIGHVTDTEPFYMNSDIFIFPSDGEGLGNSFIEALAYGLLCISYDNTSFPELYQLGFNFLLVEDQNKLQLKETLLQAVKNYSTHHENPEKAIPFFSIKREVEELNQLLV